VVALIAHLERVRVASTSKPSTARSRTTVPRGSSHRAGGRLPASTTTGGARSCACGRKSDEQGDRRWNSAPFDEIGIDRPGRLVVVEGGGPYDPCLTLHPIDVAHELLRPSPSGPRKSCRTQGDLRDFAGVG
jgi:hypothetical protein